MTSFREMGIPFRLFDAPVADARQYMGVRHCTTCAREGHCFNLSLNGSLVVRCGTCANEVALDARRRTGQVCGTCRTQLEFPYPDQNNIATCYRCLVDGKAALTKDTELGMIRHEDALRGITHGIPGLNRTDFELVPLDDDGWVGAKLPPPIMLELLRTPGYTSIQGENWLFCCGGPMIYVGRWSREKFSEMAPDRNGRNFFNQIVRDPIDGLWEDELHDKAEIYVFRCPTCLKYSANWDMY